MAKQPQDHKSKAKKDQEQEPHAPDDLFEYTSRDGKHTIRIPYLENLTRGQTRKLSAAATDEEAEDVLFSMLLDDDEQAVLDELTLWDYTKLVETWNAESAITLGESKAS